VAKKSIWLTKGGHQIVTLDMMVPTNKGMLYTMYFKQKPEIAVAATDNKPKRMTIMEAHNKLGHSNGCRAWNQDNTRSDETL
jgi:hypothetical protein